MTDAYSFGPLELAVSIHCAVVGSVWCVLSAAASRGSVSGSDMLLSTLAGYIEALGSRLELHATFPGHPEEEIAIPVGATSAGR